MKKYVGIDMSRSMLDAGKVMLSKAEGLSPVFYDKTADVVLRAKEKGERYDLAVLSFTLSELTTDNARQAAVQLMYELLDVNGVLLILESGNPVGSHMVRSARKFVLETFNGKGVGGLKQVKPAKRIPGTALTTAAPKDWSIVELLLPPPRSYASYEELSAAVIAPCTHDKACPLAPGSFCSFSQKVVSGVIRQDSEEKFSYVVIQKVARNRPEIEAESVSSPRGFSIRSNPTEDRSQKTKMDDWLLPARSPSRTEPPTHLAVLTRIMATPKNRAEALVERLLDEVDWSDYKPPLFREQWNRILR